MAQSKKHQKQKIQTTRICVLGPSFVGKTQIVNRLVNNHFYPQYIETEELETYRILYNRAQAIGSQPDLVQIEILDCFPQDHPLLFTDSNSSDEALNMQAALKKIIENSPEDDSENSEQANSGQKYIQAFIFVYNSADQNSFKKLLKIIKSVHEFEESQALGKSEEDMTRVYKYVIGTKKDLKPSKQVLSREVMAELEQFNTYDQVRLQEVSALTAYGIQEVFTSIIDEVVVGQVSNVENSQRQQVRDDSEEDGSLDESEEEESEEETKQEIEPSHAASMVDSKVKQQRMPNLGNQDYMTREDQKYAAKKRESRKNQEGADGGRGDTASKKRSKSGRSESKKEEGYDAKSVIQSFMPFLFAKPTDQGNSRSRTRK